MESGHYYEISLFGLISIGNPPSCLQPTNSVSKDTKISLKKQLLLVD